MDSIIKKIFSVALVFGLAVSLSACKSNPVSDAKVTSLSTQTEAGTDEKADTPVVIDKVLGEGAVSFTFEVVDAEKNAIYFTINTDKATVGEALQDVELVSGDESEYGLYVKTVNGITADYDVDKTYWAFYIDGEYASTGVSSTAVEAGKTYSFKVEQ